MRKAVLELIKRGVVLTLLFAFGSANATTWYVDAATGSSSHSGKSMSDAFKEIQTAIDKAANDDVVMVNDGTYSPISTTKRITIKSVNGREKTFIDGKGTRRCANFENTVSTLIGFTLKRGYADYGGGAYYGTVRDCIITGCKASEDGGGAYYSHLFSCAIENNSASDAGGGVCWGHVWGCTVRYNSAFYGGGVCEDTACSSLIVDNEASDSGGGAYMVHMYNCTVVNNIAPDGGGTLWGYLVNCIVWNNYTSTSRTIINNWDSTSCNATYTCTYPEISGIGNITSDPRFVDAGKGDYRLKSDSPCLDVGANIQSLPGNEAMLVDMTNQERIRNGRIDMGAYELQVGDMPCQISRTWYVNGMSGDDANDGRTVQSPFANINTAIAWALDGDVISVAAGIYSPIQLYNKKIRVQGIGGWLQCVIDCDLDRSFDSCVENMAKMASPTNAAVVGFTIRNGRYHGVDGGTYERCAILNNNCSWDGGGAQGASLLNCLVAGNRSSRNGGGLYCCRARNCTIVGNSASSAGGGAYAPYLLANCIIYGNTAGSDKDVSVSWTDADKRQMNNCCGQSIAGKGNIVADPKFLDAENGDYRLRDDSPCINAGVNSYARGRYDLDGNHRIKDKVVDMGAFENQTANPYVEVGYALAQQRYPWNGLVDVQFDVFGMVSNEVTNVVLSASGDVVKDLAMATFTQGDVSGLSNGTWHCVWDAGTDAPRVLDSNLVVRVALPDGDSCFAKATKLDTRSQPRNAAGSEELLVSAAWQDEVPPENVKATLTQTQPGCKATKLAEFTGDAVQKVVWESASAAVPGVHLFTLTLKENDTGRVLKTMTSSFNVAGGGSEPQPVFTDDPLSIPLEFGSWSALGTFLNDSRAALLRVNGMTAVPPTANVVMISLGEFAVPLSMLSGTAEPVEAVEEYGVKVYRLHIREMGDGTSDLVATVGGVPVSLLSMPPYNPDRWVEALYGMPPAYLTGEERAKWYAERDVARIEWFMTLVPQADIASYRANRAAALSETMKEQPEIGIGGLTTKTDGEALHSVTVNVKEDSVVDVFGKRTLNETNWTYAGRAFIPAGDSAVGVVSDSLSYFMTVVRAGGTAEGGGAVVTEGDSDHDGIPDSVEKMTYGTNPHSADTSGGGIPDWTKIYVYGLNPLVTDTDGDGYDDIEELMSGTDPKVPLPGANTSIRYYYDEDDQLVRIHCGATGAMSATELTPNGNPKTVKERRATK